MRQFTPFTLPCPHCRWRLRVDLPGLKVAFVVLMALGVAVATYIALLILDQRFGPAVLFSAGVLIAWLALELVSGLVIYNYGELRRDDPLEQASLFDEQASLHDS